MEERNNSGDFSAANRSHQVSFPARNLIGFQLCYGKCDSVLIIHSQLSDGISNVLEEAESLNYK